MKRNIAAFFDLDRTLIDTNSANLWAKHELLSRNITASQFARATFWNVLYHLAIIDIDRAYAEAVGHYRGESHRGLDARTRSWFHREVAHRLRPGARRALDDHRDQGHRLVILTSASSFEADVATSTWGLDDWLANRFPTDAHGNLDGTVELPLCYGPGKVTHATRWAQEHDVNLNESFFYSDSLTDLPMLERVGHARVVSPDPRLRRVATKRGWPILDW